MCRPRHSLTVLFFVAGACQVQTPELYAGSDFAKIRGQSAIAGKVVDARGAPVAGAKVTLYHLDSSTTRTSRFKIARQAAPTEKTGTYEFRDLGAGYFLLSVEKSGFPRTMRTAALKARASQQADIVLKPPVSFVVDVKDQAGKPVAGATVREFTDRGVNGECRFSQIKLRSVGFAIPCSDQNGRLQLPPLPSGDIIKLTLEHPKLAPARTDELTVSPGATTMVTMSLGVTVTLHVPVGVPAQRIKNADTGQPMWGQSVMGELATGTPKGWADAPLDPWSFAGWAQTDAHGRYLIDLAAGLARVSFEGSGFVAEHEHDEISVAADGSTVVPDIKVHPMRKVVGVVQNPDGSPSVRAVVRLRGTFMNSLQPVLTNDAGRFELKPLWIPNDPQTGKRAVVQTVVAFDPYRPLAARGEVRLDQPKEIVLKLEPHPADWPLSQFQSDLSDWERGIVPPEESSKAAAISLRGQTPPEIESVLWLNTNDQNLKLADLRGKYVLLDFWFTGCGPCHGDFPSVKLVHELYKSKGVVVIVVL